MAMCVTSVFPVLMPGMGEMLNKISVEGVNNILVPVDDKYFLPRSSVISSPDNEQ